MDNDGNAMSGLIGPIHELGASILDIPTADLKFNFDSGLSNYQLQFSMDFPSVVESALVSTVHHLTQSAENEFGHRKVLAI